MAEVQARLQALSEDYQKLQQGMVCLGYSGTGLQLIHFTDLQEIVASRQKLESQKQENIGVQKVVLRPYHGEGPRR